MTYVTRDCELCGNTDRRDVALGIVEWRPEYGGNWQTMHRCRDREACHARYAAKGEPWPVRDAYEPVFDSDPQTVRP